LQKPSTRRATLGAAPFRWLQRGHGTVCHQRLGPVPHLRHVGKRPSLTFSVSYTADLHAAVRSDRRRTSALSCATVLDSNFIKCPRNCCDGSTVMMNICSSSSSSSSSHRKVVSFSHLTYVMQLSYLGYLSNPDNHEFSFKLLIFLRTITKLITTSDDEVVYCIRITAAGSDRLQVNTAHFYRAMLCKRGLCCHAVSVCLSVRPTVTFVDHVKMNKHIFEIFSPSGSDTILVFPHHRGCRYSDGNPPPPNGGVECKGV